mgnify:CR=1 FL=1
MLMSASTIKAQDDQRGFASILIAMVLVLVLSLITVGFAQLMQREQREALDKQLSSQAYYAAESGVNDASKALNAGFANAKTNCEPLTGAAASLTGAQYISETPADTSNIATATGSSYTCLLIDPAPLYLEYGSIDTSQSKAIIVREVNPSDTTQPAIISRIDISWQAKDSAQSNFGTGAAATTHRFKKATDWNFAPVLRAGLTPLSSTNINRDYFTKNTLAAFLYPNEASAGTTGSLSYPSYIDENSGAIADGQCNSANTPKSCTVKITDLGQANYLLDLRSIYSASQVRITAYDSSGNRLRIKNAQTVVDSTGKAQDVLRRIQVRIPSRNQYPHPDYSLQTTGNICKQLMVTPQDTSSVCRP